MSFVEAAKDAWGDPPDWVIALAAECDRTSQNQTAKRLQRSASLVSTVIRRRYPGDLDAVADIVRGELLSHTTNCPALGKLPLDDCRRWRARARNFQNGNSRDVMMYRACNRCPLHLGDEQ